jgi:hypothetical protein
LAASSLRFPLILGAVTAAMSALSAPDADGMASLAGFGLSPTVATIVLHAAPVVLCVGLVFAAQSLTNKANALVRIVALAGAGFGFGWALSFMLEAGAQAGPLLTAIAGPLRPPGPLELVGVVLAAMFIVMGVFIAALWLVGPSAKAAQTDDLDALDMAPHERPTLAQSAFGMLGYGLAVAALTLARLTDTPAPSPQLFGLIGAAACAMVLAMWPSWTIWANADELMRRRILDSYGLSGVAMLIVLFVWTGAELAGYAPPLTAFGAFLLLVIAQTVAAMAAGMTSGAILAAAPKAKTA